MQTPRAMRYRGVVVGAVLLRLSTFAPSQAQVGEDSSRSRIDAIFASYARNDAPGCVVAVFRAGEVVYTGGYGMADVAHHIPLADTTRMPIASMSKQFTAFAVLLLEAEGKIGLDDDIRRTVPELPELGQPITIRELLNHTSGLRDHWNLFDMAGWRTSDVETESDVLWLLHRQQRLNHRPGAEFLYNNTGYSLLSLLVERVSGITLRRFVTERVFGPLGMAHSDIKAEVGQVVDGLATGYWGHDPASLRVARAPFSFTGPTGVVSTVRDLALWDANFYTGRVGTRALLDSMSTPGHLADGTTFGYGMGLFIGTHRGRRMISHAGSDLGYKADLIRFPEDSLSVAVLCNAFDIAPTPLALQVADLYLPENDPVASPPTGSAREVASVTDSSPTIAAQTLAGLYWNSASGSLHRFFFENDQLVLDGGGEGKFPLAPLGHNAYRLTAAPRRYVFTFSQRPGVPLAVAEDIEGSPVRIYAHVPETTRAETPLQALAGSYSSAELEVTWEFVLRSGTLMLERHRMEPDPLTRLFGDVPLRARLHARVLPQPRRQTCQRGRDDRARPPRPLLPKARSVSRRESSSGRIRATANGRFRFRTTESASRSGSWTGSSRCSSGSIPGTNTPARAWGWRFVRRSSRRTGAGSGSNRNPARARLSTSRSRRGTPRRDTAALECKLRSSGG